MLGVCNSQPPYPLIYPLFENRAFMYGKRVGVQLLGISPIPNDVGR